MIDIKERAESVCFSDCSRVTPPDFAEEPRPNDTKLRPIFVTECSDWSKEDPPDFREGSPPDDTEEVAPSCLQKDEMFNSCGREQTGPGSDPSTTNSIRLLGHRLGLKKRFGSVSEGTEGAENITVLNRVYTELYITEGRSQGVNTPHEVGQLEAMLKNATNVSPIRVHDIFKSLPSDPKPIRVVLTSGVAGIGKTFSVRKFTLDWAKALENQDLDLVVPLFFRELNLVREQRFSLLELVKTFHPDLAYQNPPVKTLTLKKVLFILDGFDESRLPLEFNCEVICDITQKSEVNVLLVNLIKGTLLPSALIWITSRPAAANQIPARCVDRVTEVRGFVTEAQKEEYFSKRFRDEELSGKVLSHIKMSKNLHIMCQIPVFCWITATVLDHILRTGDTGRGPLPQTLTHMYAHFMLVLTHRKRKYRQENSGPELTEADCEVLLKLGRLAFEQLQKGNIMFYQEDLEQVGLDVTDASIYSGVCTEIFKQESTIFQKSVYCFIHLSVQEFLAAVYMHHCFSERDKEVLEPFLWDSDNEEEEWSEEEEDSDEPLDLDEFLEDFLNQALLKSFKSESGHLDLLVRFLHGLCLESNRKPLARLLGSEWVRPGTLQKVQNQLKSMKVRFISPDKGINILHCLLEMNDHSVHQQIQDFLKSEDRSMELTELQCSALAYMLQMSEKVLDELDLNQYNASPDARLRLIPAVKNCTRARISECLLSKAHYEVLVSALGSDWSPLRELDLRGHCLQDTGLKTLCVGLNNPHCRLETLVLANCRLTEDGCKILAHVLEKSKSLKELDLSSNRICDEGLEILCSTIQCPEVVLHTLRLTRCGLTILSCSSLASVLQSGSGLKRLEMNNNSLLDSGLDLLAPGLRSPLCRLETLSLTHCELTEQSCQALASALSSSPLTELDLSCNPIKDSGLTLLSSGLQGSGLQALRLRCCLLTDEGVRSLAPVLKETQLKELDLSLNKLRDQAVEPLKAALQGPHCLLTLRLKDCLFSKEACEALLLALDSNRQNLTQLDLAVNQV